MKGERQALSCFSLFSYYIFYIMRKLFALLFLATSVMAMAQSTARKFLLKNSSDGGSEITVYLPAADKATGRCVVDCPGGGYSHLATDHEGHAWADFYNSKGIAFIVLKYRMPQGDRNIPLSDAYNAIKTARDSAKVWNINPRDIGIQGFSAGGHLASAVSTHAPIEVRPNFSILFYPVISMNERITHKGSCVGFLGDNRNNEKLQKEWSSDMAVRRHLTPPAIIFTSSDDRTVPVLTNSLSYYTSMRKAGNDCALMIYPTGGHGWGFRSNFKYHEQMKAELTAWLEALPAAAPNAKKVACVGNSITDGMGIDMSETYGYPAVLGRRLGAGYEVKNFGVSGRTMLNKGDHPYMKEQAWRDCLGWQPDVVIIKLGTNDSKDIHRQFLATEFAKDAQEMIDSLRALPSNPRIILATPIPAFRDMWTISDSVITNQIIPIIQEVAKKNNLELLDLHTPFTNEKWIQSDAIHPNSDGAAEIAKLVAEQLKKEAPAPAKKQTKKTKKKK